MSVERKKCKTSGCNGTLRHTDPHSKCASCRKGQKLVVSPMHVRSELKQAADAEREAFQKRLNMSITDPMSKRVNPSIAWLLS